MTNEQVRDGFNEVYNSFWNHYKNQQPKEASEWEHMHTAASALQKKYPFLEEAVNRMLAELLERGARGKGNEDEAVAMVKGVFSDSYNFYLKYHGKPMNPEAWESATNDFGEIMKRHGSVPICGRIMLAVFSQLEEEKR